MRRYNFFLNIMYSLIFFDKVKNIILNSPFSIKNYIFANMTQPQLYIIADHQLTVFNSLCCKTLLEELPIDIELENYLFYASHLTNEPPQTRESLRFQKTDELGRLCFEVNGIVIKLAKNAIQLQFPVIFRSFSDYDYLRIAIYALLLKLLSACKSTEFTAYPSFWKYSQHEIKNSWHERRLLAAQKQICENCISYRRTKLHLTNCLSKESSTHRQLVEKHYKGWCCKKMSEL